jgi:hypothetical protein
MLVIPALGRLRLEDHKFKPNLDYIMRPYFKKSKYKLGASGSCL